MRYQNVFLAGSSCVGKTSIQDVLLAEHPDTLIRQPLSARVINAQYPEIDYERRKIDLAATRTVQEAQTLYFLDQIQQNWNHNLGKTKVFERSVLDTLGYLNAFLRDHPSHVVAPSRSEMSLTHMLQCRLQQQAEELVFNVSYTGQQQALIYVPMPPAGVDYDRLDGVRPSQTIREYCDDFLYRQIKAMRSRRSFDIYMLERGSIADLARQVENIIYP